MKALAIAPNTDTSQALKARNKRFASDYCAPSGRPTLWGRDPGVTRCALTPGYFISRFQRDDLRRPSRSGYCPRRQFDRAIPTAQ